MFATIVDFLKLYNFSFCKSEDLFLLGNFFDSLKTPRGVFRESKKEV